MLNTLVRVLNTLVRGGCVNITTSGFDSEFCIAHSIELIVYKVLVCQVTVQFGCTYVVEGYAFNIVSCCRICLIRNLS